MISLTKMIRYNNNNHQHQPLSIPFSRYLSFIDCDNNNFFFCPFVFIMLFLLLERNFLTVSLPRLRRATNEEQ